MDTNYIKLIAKQLVEAGMSGINRAAPATNVSYEKILNDVTDTWKGQTVKVNEISANKKVDWANKATKYRDAETAKGGTPDAKTDKKIGDRAEKSMNIKRRYSAPTNEETITELSVGKLKHYSSNAKEVDPSTTPKYKLVKHAEGYAKANKQIARKTGDRTKNYESILQQYVRSIVD